MDLIYSLSTLNRKLKSAKYQGTKYFIILDENTYTHCLPLLISKVSALENAEFLELPTGEEAKSIEIATQIWHALLESNADRNSVIVNLGGGCVSDLGGFVAAGFKRGIRYVNVPTTLIGMIDAAIGGKTAVNLDTIKNQIGFFHNPEVTCIESSFLDTLTNTELNSGLGEMLKTLLLSNPCLYEQLRQAITSANVSLSDEMIQECATFKLSVVKKDPTDQSIRKILNFGHTFGHAIESYQMQKPDASPIPHGCAIAIGIWCSLYLSVNKLNLDSKILSDYTEALLKLVDIPHYNLKDIENLLAYIRQDKKNIDGLILCVLLQEIGVPVIDITVSENEIRDTFLKLSKC